MMRSLCMLALMFGIASSAWAEEKKCVVSGCGNYQCIEEEPEPRQSICLARVDDGCYLQYGDCKRQADGTCGWTMSDQLQNCISTVTKNLPGAQHPAAK